MTASKPASGTDWAEADAYENMPADYAELPELDDAFFDRARAEVGGKPMRGRRPSGSAAKRDRAATRSQDP